LIANVQSAQNAIDEFYQFNLYTNGFLIQCTLSF